MSVEEDSTGRSERRTSGLNRSRLSPDGEPVLERRTDDLYLTLVENSVVGLGLYIPGEPLVLCNHRLADITGYAMEEVIDPGFNFVELFEAEDRALITENIRRRAAGAHIPPYEVSLIRKDGNRRVVEVNNVPVAFGQKQAIQVQLIDVTERKRAEDALKQQAAALAAANQDLEEKSRLLGALQAIGDMAGASLNLDQVLDSLAEQIVKVGIFRSLMVALVDEAAGRVEVVRSFICRTEGGQAVPGTAIVSSGSIIGYHYDLNDENITAVTARTGEMQVVDGWDDRFDARIDRPENTNFKVSYFIPVKKDDRVLAVMATSSPHDQKEETLQRIETMRPLLGQVAISIDHARLFSAAQDHAREWVRMERVRAIGEMAEGIAHNFNNMLTAILGHTELARMHNRDPTVEEELDLVITASQRASELVKRLRGSARREDRSHLYPVELNEIVAQAVEGTRPMWQDRSQARGIVIEVDKQLGEIPVIGGTESEAYDMLTNLLLNAVDAMPEGGTITIVTEESQEHVQLIVNDDGIGLEEETRKRIFEPLFTTKHTVGSGLGLATVHGTVSRWGGRINVQSSPGQGAKFTILLPVWTPSEVEGVRQEPKIETTPSAGRRIIVVDDEPSICKMFAAVLGKNHQVATYVSPREARDRFVSGSWDVAVIDLGMPEIAGDELARSLKQIDPKLITVLSTGWGIEPGDARMAAFDFQLEKPYKRDRIEEVIAQALERRDTTA